MTNLVRIIIKWRFIAIVLPWVFVSWILMSCLDDTATRNDLKDLEAAKQKLVVEYMRKLTVLVESNIKYNVNVKKAINKFYNQQLHAVALIKQSSENKILPKTLEDLVATLKRALSSDTKDPDENHNSAKMEQRRVILDQTIYSLWEFLKNKYAHMKKNDAEETLFSYYKSLKNAFHEWDVSENKWKTGEFNKLANLVQKKITALQNPKDCSTAKIAVCELYKACGTMCRVHHLIHCLISSMAIGRTLSVSGEHMINEAFKPLSETCNEENVAEITNELLYGQKEGSRVVSIPYIDEVEGKESFFPPAIPVQIADRLTRIHKYPAIWWIGQVMRYIWRPQPRFREVISSILTGGNFSHPIVGVHIRRTDKINTEAQFHSLGKYMKHVRSYFDILQSRSKTEIRRAVFLASDDPSVIEEARTNYPKYTFIADKDRAKRAADTAKRENHMTDVFIDVHLLSMCDYIVCTFSSHVCRSAYELMQSRHPDASDFFYSLDDVYYFGGQAPHEVIAIEDHQSSSKNLFNFTKGDILHLKAYHKNGISSAMNKNRISGSFPSYKVIEHVKTYNFSKLFAAG